MLAPRLRRIAAAGINVPGVIRDEQTNLDARQLKTVFRQESAADFVGTLTPGFHLYGLSKGQFSLVDVIRAVIAQTGPCDLGLATWTIGWTTIAELKDLKEKAQILSARMLLDSSMQWRKSSLLAGITEVFGRASVVTTRNHCKFVTFSNPAWKIVCKTSANLTRNEGIEDVELKDDPHLLAFFDAFLGEVFAHETARQATD